jgi:parallel beta-helix repeat protein
MHATKPKMSRRTFLTAAGFAIPAALLWNKAIPATFPVPQEPPLDGLRSALASLRTGEHDATATIQMLVDQSVAQGVAAQLPTGRYLINPDTGIELRSGSHLVLSDNTQLIAMPSSNTGYGIVRLYGIDNASVTGGSIVGERQAHSGSGGEWGMGIDIRGSSNIVISDITVSDCWGDGFYIGKGPNNHQPCRNITLERVTGTGNRRQGLSVVACIGANIFDSKFQNTAGTSPCAGIDVEPDNGDLTDAILIRNCELTYNAGAGIETRTHAEGVTIENCTISDNSQGGILLLNQSKRIAINGNTISNSRGPSIFVGKKVQGYSIHKNTLHATFMGKGLDIEH